MDDDSLAPVEAWALVEILYCLLSTMTASLFAKVFLLIHLQSGIHLFNIQSNTLQLAQPCLSTHSPACSSGCFVQLWARQTERECVCASAECAHEGMMKPVCASVYSWREGDTCVCAPVSVLNVCVHTANRFLCDCQRVPAPSSPLSNKLRLQSKVAIPSAQGFVVFFPVTRFAHWVFIINVNKLEGHPLFSLSSHLENGPNYRGHRGDMSETQSQLWLNKITLELDALQEEDIDVVHFQTHCQNSQSLIYLLVVPAGRFNNSEEKFRSFPMHIYLTMLQ